MSKRNQNTFLKRQKEIKRQQKAQEKMAKRHGLKGQESEEDLETTSTAEEQETSTEETPETSQENTDTEKQ